MLLSNKEMFHCIVQSVARFLKVFSTSFLLNFIIYSVAKQLQTVYNIGKMLFITHIQRICEFY